MKKMKFPNQQAIAHQ